MTLRDDEDVHTLYKHVSLLCLWGHSGSCAIGKAFEHCIVLPCMQGSGVNAGAHNAFMDLLDSPESPALDALYHGLHGAASSGQYTPPLSLGGIAGRSIGHMHAAPPPAADADDMHQRVMCGMHASTSYSAIPTSTRAPFMTEPTTGVSTTCMHVHALISLCALWTIAMCACCVCMQELQKSDLVALWGMHSFDEDGALELAKRVVSASTTLSFFHG